MDKICYLLTSRINLLENKISMKKIEKYDLLVKNIHVSVFNKE